MDTALQQKIERQRSLLEQWLRAPLRKVACDCGDRWNEREALEQRLMTGLLELPYCKYLYVPDDRLRQISSNASRNGILGQHRGRDRSERPYLAEARAGQVFSLSQA